MTRSTRHILPLTLLIAMLIFGGCWLLLNTNREEALAEQKQRLNHLTETLAAHNAHSLENINVLLLELSRELSKDNYWSEWSQQQGREYLVRHHNTTRPQLRNLIVFDLHGNSRFSSVRILPQGINISDRPYFQSLLQGAESILFGPYVSRNTGDYAYSLDYRLNDGSQKFLGAIHAALDPKYFQDFCWPIRLNNDFDSVLVNRTGEIIASCRPTDLSARSPLLGAKFFDALANGDLRGARLTDQTSTYQGWIVSKTPVPGFPDLEIISIVSEEALLNQWQSRFSIVMTLATITVFILFLGGWLISRKNRHLDMIKAEFQAMQQKLSQELELSANRLEEQRLDAERASTAKNRFLAAASHDLRQPLHALALFASDLHRQIRFNNTEQLQYLAYQIQTSTEAIRELLDSLLDLSRLDVSGITPQLHNFPIDLLFERLATTFDRAALAKGVQLRFRSYHQVIHSDAALLERLLANLVSNAIRYTEKGSILVSARRKGDQVLVEVRDTGIGIAQEHQQAIFTEFYQVNNAARESHKGLGLGLSIVDRLAVALGIQVELKSWLGKGTRFSMIIEGEKAQETTERTSDPGNTTIPSLVVGIQGCCSELQEAGALIAGWGYTLQHDLENTPLPHMIVTCSADAGNILEKFPQTPILVLCEEHESLPLSVHRLNLPLRPARLRALLRRLE